MDMEEITAAMRAEVAKLGMPVELIPSLPESCHSPEHCQPGHCEDPRWCISAGWDEEPGDDEEPPRRP